MRLRPLITLMLAAAFLAVFASPAYAVHRSVAVSRGRAWVYDKVPYSQSKNHEGYRTDCSGFTSMCWQLAKPGLSTRTLGSVCTTIPFSALLPGDALCYPGHHVFVFGGWADSKHTSVIALEEASTALGTVQRVRKLSSLSSGYRAYRYKKIELDPRWTSRLQPIEGADRYQTAAKASAAAFTSESTVVIASGQSWPDALGASALAGALDVPILLVAKNGVPLSTKNEITRLGAKTAIVVGGTGAVSDTVVGQLRTSGMTVNERLAGSDRVATASKVAQRSLHAMTTAKRTYDRTVLIAGQDGWADALVAGGLSARKGWPLLLSGRTALGTETVAALEALKANRAFILGGSGVVGEEVLEQLKDRGITVERLAGSDRYRTALAVAAKAAYYGMSWYSVAVASGTSWADAVASGPVQAKANSFLLLTPGRSLYPAVETELIAHRFKTPRIRTLGGDAAVNYEVRHSLYDAAAP